MINLLSRTVASGDAVHAVALFVINDEGAWMLKRPRDYPRSEVAELARAGRSHEFVRQDFGYFLVDERNRFRPAGIARFARSKGGHLSDDPEEAALPTFPSLRRGSTSSPP
jgi:hypothetical protein